MARTGRRPTQVSISWSSPLRALAANRIGEVRPLHTQDAHSSGFLTESRHVPTHLPSEFNRHRCQSPRLADSSVAAARYGVNVFMMITWDRPLTKLRIASASRRINCEFCSAPGAFILIRIGSAPRSCALNNAASPKNAARPDSTRITPPCSHPPTDVRSVSGSKSQAMSGFKDTKNAAQLRCRVEPCHLTIFPRRHTFVIDSSDCFL